MSFLAQARLSDRPRLQPLILVLARDFVVRDILAARNLNFKYSYHFMSRFLDRANLSFQGAPTTRLPLINDKPRVDFLAQLTTLQVEYPVKRFPTSDESIWMLVMVSERLIAERGAKVIRWLTGADPKARFSFFATCAADGSKFPLVSVAK
jgi:hypothetical protein